MGGPADGDWALDDLRAGDPGHISEFALHFSPVGNGVPLGTAETSQRFDLTELSTGKLTFNYFLDPDGRQALGDVARVELGNTDATVLASSQPGEGLVDLVDGAGGWQSVEIDLREFLDESFLNLRFVYESTTFAPDGAFDGWHVDDITISGTPNLTADDVLALPAEKGINFQNDLASLPIDILNGRSDVTVQFRFRSDAPTDQSIISGARSDAANNEFLVFLRAGGGLFAGGNDFSTLPGVDLHDGEWHEYTIQRQASIGFISFYVDGELQDAQPLASATTMVIAPDGLLLGQDQDEVAGRFQDVQRLRGDLAELRFWDSALSPSQIPSGVGGFLTGNEAGLIAYYQFDTVSGSPLADLSGNGRDATFGHAATATIAGVLASNSFDAIPRPARGVYRPAPSISSVGDATGDGLDDFAVTSAARGEVYVIPGTQSTYAGLVPPPAVVVPEPLSAWTFNEDASDVVGTSDGNLFNGARIEDGGLVLDGVNDYLRTLPVGADLNQKTLVAWVSADNLTQRSGGVLSVEDATGADRFDAIVFGERTARQWMNGSEFFNRTPFVNNFSALETQVAPREVMIAVQYYASTGLIRIFRDGCADIEHDRRGGRLRGWRRRRADGLASPGPRDRGGDGGRHRRVLRRRGQRGTPVRRRAERGSNRGPRRNRPRYRAHPYRSDSRHQHPQGFSRSDRHGGARCGLCGWDNPARWRRQPRLAGYFDHRRRPVDIHRRRPRAQTAELSRLRRVARHQRESRYRRGHGGPRRDAWRGRY